MSRTSVKSPDAFRTISEAADALDLPQHVLRFWETRFSQIKPMKRSGGRRYYRPTDIALLQGIRHLLYEEGYTIKGVQRILREQGIAHVAGLDQSRAASKVASEAAPVSLPASGSTPVSNPAPAKAEPHVPEPPVVEPPAPEAHPVQQTPVGPRLADSAPTAPAQPLPSFVAQHEEAHTPPAQPAINQPVAAPAQSAPQMPAPQTSAPQAFPPLGSFGGPSSLRFVPDTEAASEPAVPQAAPYQTPEPLPPRSQQPQPTPLADTPVAAPVPAQAPATNGMPRLNAQDTETLVRALRTLLDCKAILDSTRQPTPKPGSASS